MKERFVPLARVLAEAYSAGGGTSGDEVTPDLLIEAVGQALDVMDRLDRDRTQAPIAPEDATNLADHALRCLSDLALWSQRLGCGGEVSGLNQLALDAALWTARRGGSLRTLEPVVNALAARANSTAAPEDLRRLYTSMEAIVGAADPSIRNDLEKADPARPWRVLLLNFAIVATRTQDPDLITRSYDLLGALLPEDCPAFFEEALQQSEKAVYGPEVRDLARSYFERWHVRH